MASNPPPIIEDLCNTGTDEETVALRKKRSRRVSFADREITSVHIFNRDEDFETPPDSSAKKPSSELISDAENEVLGFFRDLADSDDSKEMSPAGDEDGYDDIVDARRSFLRPIESPSPGSSVVGSATSNDEDNFFGPVSASFIRPGRLSDSAASDDNHDVTMDSTAFSMHYRSLARSDSGGNTFEEKTPSHITTPSDSGSFMVLSNVKKIIPQFSLRAEKVSGSRDSNNMSLVGENPSNYGYGKLSPTLEALLAEGSKDLQNISVSESPNKHSLKMSQVSMFDENLSGHIDQRDCKAKETVNVGKLGLSPVGVSAVCLEFDEVNGTSLTTLVDQITSGCSSVRNEDLATDAPVDQQMQTPNQLSKVYSNCREDVNVEFPSGDLKSKNGEVLQPDSFAQHESVKNPNGISPEKSRESYGIYQKFDQKHKSPLLVPILSMSTEQQQICLDTDKSCGQLLCVTPSPKQPNSFLGKENTKSGDNFLSFNKSISKFQISEPSPLASALKDGIERSKLRVSKLFSSTTSPFNVVAEASCKSMKSINVDTVDSNSEKCLFSTDEKNRQHEITNYMDRAGIQNQEKVGGLSKIEGTKSLVEHGEFMSMHIFTEGANLLMKEVVSPSQFTQLQKKDSLHNLIPEKSIQQTVVVCGSDSSSIDFKLDSINDAKTSIPPEKSGSPPAKISENILPSSTERQCTSLLDLQPDEFVCSGLGQDKSSIAYVTSNSNSTVVTDELKALLAGDGELSSSSLLEINGIGDLNQVEKVHDRQNYLPALQHASKTLLISNSSLRERNAQKFLAGIPDRNILFATDPVHSEAEFPGGWNEASLPASASHDINRTNISQTSVMKSPLKKEMTESLIKKLTHSPSIKDLHKVLDNGNVQSLAGKIIVSPNFTHNDPGDGDSHLNGIPALNIELSSERKRSFEELVAQDVDHAEKYRRIKRSPDLYRSQDSDLEFMLESDNSRKMTRSDKTMKHWSDILQKFSIDTQQLLSPLTEKLNIRSIAMLQDIVLHLKKIKIFEMLNSQIQSQRMCDQSGEIWRNRVSETKMLLYKLAYEKARLQLMSVESDKLLKRAQQLSSAVHKSQMLKLNRTCLYLPGDRDTAVDNLRCTFNMSSKHELSRGKLDAMKHEFEALDRKIKNLTKSFHSYCKMKGEPSCSETIALLNDHLKKKTSCKIIHEDLQLWEVDHFGSRDLKQKIVLNYRGLFCQRFVINDGPPPSVFISNNLDDTNITKNFPNMDACSAFAWVLNANTTKKLVGFKSFAQETQITCLLLHNLLNVIGEVQLALVEIRNLVQTRFHSSSVEQLDLLLCFINFNNGRKVMVTLDMTCLKRGVYPSDILPYRLQASIAGTCMPVPESLSARITAAVDGLGVGYSRIIRLCKCISQVVLSSST